MWVALGCGGILLLCVIAFVGAAYWGVNKAKQFASDVQKNPAKIAELAVRMNPDFEVLSTDEARKEITVRDKKSGKITKVSFDQNGKIEFESDGQRTTINGDKGGLTVSGPDGSKATFGAGTAERPSWVPLYPGAPAPQGLMSTTTDKEKAGTLSLAIADSAEKVATYYKDQLTAAGFKIETEVSSGTGSSLSAKSADGLRTVSVILTPGDNNNGTNAMITYSEKTAS